MFETKPYFHSILRNSSVSKSSFFLWLLSTPMSLPFRKDHRLFCLRCLVSLRHHRRDNLCKYFPSLFLSFSLIAVNFEEEEKSCEPSTQRLRLLTVGSGVIDEATLLFLSTDGDGMAGSSFLASRRIDKLWRYLGGHDSCFHGESEMWLCVSPLRMMRDGESVDSSVQKLSWCRLEESVGFSGEFFGGDDSTLQRLRDPSMVDDSASSANNINTRGKISEASLWSYCFFNLPCGLNLVLLCLIDDCMFVFRVIYFQRYLFYKFTFSQIYYFSIIILHLTINYH